MNREESVPPVLLIGPRRGLLQLDLAPVFRYRELLYFLVWRDVAVRYKQTVIGIGWAILQPLLTVVVFTVIFGKFARMPSQGLPYQLFSLAGLLPWTYFAQAVSRSGTSLVSNSNLISKVYFPRLIVPISAALGPLVDFGIMFVMLMAMMAWYGVKPGWAVLALPAFLVLAFLTVLAPCLFLSALNVRFRDVGHAIPFLVQVWMYASPVVYSTELIPAKWKLLYSLNPMVGVIEGFRWALLGTAQPDFGVMLLALVVVSAMLVGGVIYFKYVERTFADVI